MALSCSIGVVPGAGGISHDNAATSDAPVMWRAEPGQRRGTIGSLTLSKRQLRTVSLRRIHRLVSSETAVQDDAFAVSIHRQATDEWTHVTSALMSNPVDHGTHP